MNVSDVQVGQSIPPFVVEGVSAEKMKTMAALIHDPNPIHFDSGATRALGMGERVVNQGPTNMAYIVNALSSWAGTPAAVRNLRCRFNGNVFADDRVVAGGLVTAVHPSHDTAAPTCDGGRFEVECEVWLDRDGDRVVTGTARLVVEDS